MLLAILIGLAPAVLVPPPVTAATIEPICRNPGIVVADASPAAGIHPLASEPPAREIKAVVREIDGCNTPIVISAEVGVPRR